MAKRKSDPTVSGGEMTITVKLPDLRRMITTALRDGLQQMEKTQAVRLMVAQEMRSSLGKLAKSIVADYMEGMRPAISKAFKRELDKLGLQRRIVDAAIDRVVGD